MSEAIQEAFVTSVVQNLEKHGYPARRVALPLDKMYEIAHGKGLNFNKTLSTLEERGIAHEKTAEKIIFFAKDTASTMTPSPHEAMAQAAEMLKGMDPAQLEQLKTMVENMSDDERAAMLQRARDMGFGP